MEPFTVFALAGGLAFLHPAGRADKTGRHVRPQNKRRRNLVRPSPSETLLTQAKPLNDLVITRNIFALQVIQHAAALADHFQQSAP